jgi:hypothetical protein
MIRSREKRNRRLQRATLRTAAHEHRDEPLRVLARILARAAAHERFEREMIRQREPSPEVTVQ